MTEIKHRDISTLTRAEALDMSVERYYDEFGPESPDEEETREFVRCREAHFDHVLPELSKHERWFRSMFDAGMPTSDNALHDRLKSIPDFVVFCVFGKIGSRLPVPQGGKTDTNSGEYPYLKWFHKFSRARLLEILKPYVEKCRQRSTESSLQRYDENGGR